MIGAAPVASALSAVDKRLYLLRIAWHSAIIRVVFFAVIVPPFAQCGQLRLCNFIKKSTLRGVR